MNKEVFHYDLVVAEDGNVWLGDGYVIDSWEKYIFGFGFATFIMLCDGSIYRIVYQ